MRIIAFLSYHLAHIFTPGLGPVNVCMHCLGVSRALDLGVHSPHYILHMFASPHFHLTSSVVLFVSSYLPCLLLICIIFFHPEWWASSVHHMEDGHIISTIYLTDIGLEILSLRRSSRYREFWVALALGLVSTRYRHHPWGSFVHVQGMCICIYVKKKKCKEKKKINNKHMCVCA